MDPLNEKVRVRFITKHEEFKVLDAPLAIPSTLNRSGLIEVINHLLSRDEIQAFDFLVDNRILRQPLYKLLQKLQLSTENVITIEYFPSVSLSEKSEGSILITQSYSYNIFFPSYSNAIYLFLL